MKVDKTHWALKNVETGQFWDGAVPNNPHGYGGVVPYYHAKWKPRFCPEPRVFSEDTAQRRWKNYERMREINSDIPRLVRVPVRVNYEVLDNEVIEFELDERERLAARIQFLHGEHPGNSWRNGNFGRDATFYYSGNLPAENFPNHETGTQWGHFLTFDERTLLRFIHPKAHVVDVSDALGDEPLKCETEDPAMLKKEGPVG